MNEGFPLKSGVHKVHQKQWYTGKQELPHLTNEAEVALGEVVF